MSFCFIIRRHLLLPLRIEPLLDYLDDIVDLLCGQRVAFGDIVPPAQAGSAAGGGGVLGDEGGVASHRGLPAVFWRLRRRESLLDESAGVVQYRGRPFAAQVFPFGGAETEPAAKPRPRQGPEKVVEPVHVLP